MKARGLNIRIFLAAGGWGEGGRGYGRLFWEQASRSGLREDPNIPLQPHTGAAAFGSRPQCATKEFPGTEPSRIGEDIGGNTPMLRRIA